MLHFNNWYLTGQTDDQTEGRYMDKDSREINVSNSFYPHRAKSKRAVCPEV